VRISPFTRTRTRSTIALFGAAPAFAGGAAMDAGDGDGAAGVDAGAGDAGGGAAGGVDGA
jgi:hypothetical protein